MFECHDHYDSCFTLTHCIFDVVVIWLNAIDQWVFQCSTGFVDGGEFYYCSPLCFNTFVVFKVLVD